ncbi:MAG: aldehyde dehydrogenase family protein [Waddliaceae bacterium]
MFGPVLALMRADNLEHAINLANGTRYGLTSGLHSLDEREHDYWIDHIQAGNCYINRGITGAIVQRQPFGGCKESNFGRGAKAGGPNFLMQLMNPEQVSLPMERESVGSPVNVIGLQLEKKGASTEQMELWNASVESYAYYWKYYFSKKHDPSRIVGQDNFLMYVPHSLVVLRVDDQDDILNVLRVIAAAILCQTPLQVSGEHEKLQSFSNGDWLKLAGNVEIKEETEIQFIERIKTKEIKRVRLLSPPSLELKQVFADAACNAIVAPVLANGRVELLHYLREVSLSVNYHRYGNLGARENEERAPVL